MTNESQSERKEKREMRKESNQAEGASAGSLSRFSFLFSRFSSDQA
jgi:hypothetical protein